MKKLFSYLILFLLGSFALAQESNLVPDYDSLNQTALNHLVNLINIDTAQPEPKEILAQRYIYKNLIDNKIDWQIFRVEKPRANLIATLKSTAQTPQKPLILCFFTIA